MRLDGLQQRARQRLAVLAENLWRAESSEESFEKQKMLFFWPNEPKTKRTNRHLIENTRRDFKPRSASGGRDSAM